MANRHTINYDDRLNSVLRAFVRFCDVTILVTAFALAALRDGLTDRIALVQSAVLLVVTYLACTLHHGIILHIRGVHAFQIVVRVTANMLFFAVVATPLAMLAHVYLPSPLFYVAFLLGTALVISFERVLIFSFVTRYRTSQRHLRRGVLVGAADNMLRLYHEFTDDPIMGFAISGYFADEPRKEFPEACPYLGKPEQVTEWLAAHTEVRELYCALPSARRELILSIIHYCENHLVRYYGVPNVLNYLHNRLQLNMVGSTPYFSLYENPFLRFENRFIKRAFDFVFSLVFLCTLFPIVLVVVTIITKLTMPGPVFFRQRRNGLDGKVFYCLKFRSMRINDQADTLQATEHDPRTTRWGEIMRHTNIDELPQFINVLLGQMSVVGPRPHMVKHTEEYSALIDKYMMRHEVKPGITGWSQVTGFRGETRHLSEMEGRIRGDLWYIEHWSPSLDLWIIYRTVVNAIFGDKKAY